MYPRFNEDQAEFAVDIFAICAKMLADGDRFANKHVKVLFGGISVLLLAYTPTLPTPDQHTWDFRSKTWKNISRRPVDV